jgi:hypothetical protein
MTSHISEGTKHAVDAVSVATVIGTLAQILPSIAALFTIVWTSFRIYELRTIQKWLGKGAKDEEAND